jgi:hypothetical protein
MESLIDQLTLWAINGSGSPGSVATRYSCEVQLSDHPETADVRCAIRTAFIDGMTFNAALADAKHVTLM